MNDEEKHTISDSKNANENWQGPAFDAPDLYSTLSPGLKEQIGELSPELCIVRHKVATYYFIRGILTLNVADHSKGLEYSVWVFVSEESFQDYRDNLDNPNHRSTYYGWLGNALPGYEGTGNIPVEVVTRPNGLRPEIVPEEKVNHRLVHDYYNGITKVEAEERIRAI